MGLNENQKRAVEYLDGPLLVLAGPGTGKTQLLSHKVAYILQNTDTSPENILCLTFTETGAKNMRERLKTIIGKDALKVNIGTYHAFGSEILVQYKNYTSDYNRRLDEAVDEVAQYKIIKNLQDKLPATDILKGDNVKDIISVIGEAKAAGLSPEDLQQIAEQNIADSKVLSEAISPLLKNIVPRAFRESYENAYRPIYEVLQQYSEIPPIFGTIERSIAGLTRDLKEALAEAESSEKIKPLSGWKDKYFEKDAKGNYRLKDRIANKKLQSVARLMAKYEAHLSQNGRYDFNDMIEEAVRILRTDEGFKLTLQERYQFIMLDEFQDTNPSQFSIVKGLTDYEKPMIMAVGDDDQAIYEFQGAMSSNLTDFQRHYEAEVIPLVENYRSTQEILDFSHAIIQQAPDRFADKELIAHKKNPEKSQIHRFEFLSADAECGFVADRIAELVKAGVKQSEIAIISYKSKYFEPLLPYLKAKPGLKIAYEKRDNLFLDEKIHEILTIARFVWEMANNKKTTVQIMEILTYPYFQIPALEVVKLTNLARVEHKSLIDVLTESDNLKIREAMQFLSDLMAKSFVEPLEIMLDYIIGTAELNGYRSPFLAYFTGMTRETSAYVSSEHKKSFLSNDAAYENFLFYENLAILRGKLTRYYGEKALKLGDLITMIDDYLAAEMPLTATSPYRDAEDAVQILTAHKAKGLEFEYVFIIAADHTAWGKGKGNNNLLALPRNLMQIRHTGTTDGEKLRILYVALTRAKKCLYITNALHDFNDKSPERLEYFEEYADNGTVVSPFLPTRTVQCLYDVASTVEREQNLRNWLAAYVPNSPDMRTIYLERASEWRMSASALTTFIDIVYAGPQEFFKSYILKMPREPETEALAFGNLIHTVFETVTNQNISNQQALDLFLSELENRELTAEVKQNIRTKGPVDLAVALETFGDILRCGLAEVDFAAEKLVIDGVPITGKIDHLVIDEENKKIEIYDFKTGGYHKEKWQSHATLYKYMLQLGFYKLLLNHSPRYAKYRVEKAHILFVTPDKDGEVYDKVYDFNEQDEKLLLGLMKAMYNVVSSMKFVEEADLFVPPNDKLGLKEIRQFVDKLICRTTHQD